MMVGFKARENLFRRNMAHNPLNDLYVDSVEEVSRDTQPYWEIASAICNRDLRRHQTQVAHRLTQKQPRPHSKEESHAQPALSASQEAAQP
jgi:hypothetical protein